MLRSFLKNSNSLSKNKRFISTNQILFNNLNKQNKNKKGLDFWFGEGEDNAHPNTKHYKLPEEEFGKYWQGIPSVYENSVGLERAEIMDPFYFDELLPTFVDVEEGVGLTKEYPIIVPTMGEKERVVACYGDCGNPDGAPEDYEDDFNYWVGDEGTHAQCLGCKLHFYFASNEDVERLGIDVQGRDIYTRPSMKKHFSDLKEQLSSFLKQDFTTKKETIQEKEYEDAVNYLDQAKGQKLFNDEILEKAKEYLAKFKASGFQHIGPEQDKEIKEGIHRLLELIAADEAHAERVLEKQNKFIELHRLEYALPHD
eukprot:gene10742-3362_t